MLSPEEIKEAIKCDPKKMNALVNKILQVFLLVPFQVRLNNNEPLLIGGYSVTQNWLLVYGFMGALHLNLTEWIVLSDTGITS